MYGSPSKWLLLGPCTSNKVQQPSLLHTQLARGLCGKTKSKAFFLSTSPFIMTMTKNVLCPYILHGAQTVLMYDMRTLEPSLLFHRAQMNTHPLPYPAAAAAKAHLNTRRQLQQCQCRC